MSLESAEVIGVTGWVVLAVAAVCVGFAKTAIGGAGALSVALFATVFPAKESTGALLPLLLVGDLVAIVIYRAHVSWRTLLRLLPAVVVGVLLGVLFVGAVDDTVMRRTIGALLVALVLVQLWRRRRLRQADGAGAGGHAAAGAPPLGAHPRVAAAGYGTLAGFTTMVANAGGAVTAMYLLSMRLDMLRFLGTTAWFFFAVNLGKLPFSIGLGLVHPSSLAVDAVLVPLVLVGAWVGRRVIVRLDQARFESVVLAVTLLSAIPLLR